MKLHFRKDLPVSAATFISSIEERAQKHVKEEGAEILCLVDSNQKLEDQAIHLFLVKNSRGAKKKRRTCAKFIIGAFHYLANIHPESITKKERQLFRNILDTVQHFSLGQQATKERIETVALLMRRHKATVKTKNPAYPKMHHEEEPEMTLQEIEKEALQDIAQAKEEGCQVAKLISKLGL